MARVSGRKNNEMREVKLTLNPNKHAEGSCLICMGDTQVLCTATLEDKVPLWVKGTGQGWITAEYGMLPRSTATRMDRESKKGQSGRTHEIQRLIGRALRMCIDLKALDGFTIKLDCDVIQADGGTRCASITGAFIALYLACQKLVKNGQLSSLPITRFIAAISCGVVQGEPVLDLDYEEDSSAGTDSNFVLTDSGEVIEMQLTAEHAPCSNKQIDALKSLAEQGVSELIKLQKKVLLGL